MKNVQNAVFYFKIKKRKKTFFTSMNFGRQECPSNTNSCMATYAHDWKLSCYQTELGYMYSDCVCTGHVFTTAAVV